MVTGQVMLIRIVASLCAAAAAAGVRTASLHSQVCSEGHGLLLFVLSSSTGVAKHS